MFDFGSSQNRQTWGCQQPTDPLLQKYSAKFSSLSKSCSYIDPSVVSLNYMCMVSGLHTCSYIATIRCCNYVAIYNETENEQIL